MYLTTLNLVVILATCWANSHMLEKDKVPTAFHKMSPSLMTVTGATLEEYSSPTLPCNGEGFYSYASDCTKFYRCIAVSNNHYYQRLVFKCHAGTVFSSEYKSCIPGTCSNGLVSAVASAVERSAATLAAGSAEYDDEVMMSSFWHQDIHHRSASSINVIQECNSTGRFADPDDCGKYYDCVRNHNGGFVARHKSCLGHAFDPTLHICVPLQTVEGCVPRSIRIVNDPDPNLEELCINATNKFFCADCRTLIMCVEGIPYIKPCGHGRVCATESSKFIGGVCYPGAPVNCTCNEDYIFRQDIYNPSKFLTCDIAGSDPKIYRCPEGKVFKEQCGTCSTDAESTCKPPGPFIINDDCTGYYTFVGTIEGWVKIEFTCKSKTMFNENTGKCEDPCDWISHFTCEEEGRFGNPADCTKYYECITDPMNSDKFILMEQKCPEGFEWSQVGNSDVVHCVPNVTATENCVPPSMPQNCIKPDWCTTVTVDPNLDWEEVGDDKFVRFDMNMNWDNARSHCISKGLDLFQPQNSVDVAKYLEDNYINEWYWIGARGNGTHQVWTKSQEVLTVEDQLNPLVGTNDCVTLDSYGEQVAAVENSCNSQFYFLCG